MNIVFKPKIIEAPLTTADDPDEPTRRDPNTGMMSREWQSWSERQSERQMAERNDRDPLAVARRPTPDEIALLDAAEIEVARAQAKVDAVVNGQLAKVPRYPDGYAYQVGVFLESSDALTEANHVIEDSIARRARVRRKVDAAQFNRVLVAQERTLRR